MDDAGAAAGEPRLPRKKPKTKRPPSAAAPPPAQRESGRGRDKFQALWQDYHDLLQVSQRTAPVSSLPLLLGGDVVSRTMEPIAYSILYYYHGLTGVGICRVTPLLDLRY
jgi:hypothetical protein